VDRADDLGGRSFVIAQKLLVPLGLCSYSFYLLVQAGLARAFELSMDSA
jgi:peptidoglycan/LPS O-acetylase OafA/YrhL